MSEEVLIVVRAEDQATPQVTKASRAIREAGTAAGRAGQDAARGSGGWVTAGNATGKAGDKARDASGKFTKAGTSAAAAGATAARGASGFSRLGASLDAAQRKAVMFGKAYRDALDDRTTTGMNVAGAALVSTLGVATFASMGFEKQMSAVKAVTSASAREMRALSRAALQAGSDTAFKARDAALAETELAKAGVATSDILGGALRGSLDLAAAGELELGRAAEISAAEMNTFGLAGKDVSMIADTLASGANKSAAGVDDLAMALSMGGTVASMMGMNIQDTTGVLSMFADAGIKGSDAGTMMKTMLMRLTPQSDEAAVAMEELGFSAYDAQGNFVGMGKVAGQLQSQLGELSAEEKNAYLTTIFGQDAYRAAAILMDQGADKVDDYTRAMWDQGAAARMAGEMMNNLDGDLEQLKGSLETTFIKGGTGANTGLRSMTQHVTGLVNGVGQLPEPLIGTAFAVTALSGGLLLLTPRILATKTALATLKTEAGGTKAMLGKLGAGLAIGIGVGLLTDMVLQGIASRKEIDDNIDSVTGLRRLLTTGKASSPLSQMMNETQQSAEDLYGHLHRSLSIATLFTAAGEGIAMWGQGDFQWEGIDREAEAMRNATKESATYKAMLGDLAFKTGLTGTDAARLADTYVQQGHSVDLLNGNYHDIADSIAEFSRETVVGTTAAEGMKEAYDNAALSVQKIGIELQRASGWLSQRQAVRSYKAAIDDAAASVKKNGKTLNDNTEKGRANAQALDDIAIAAARAYTKKGEDGTITVTDQVGFAQAEKAYERAARRAGASAKKAKQLAKGAFGEITANTAQSVIDEAQAAKDKVGETKDALTGLNGLTVDTYIRVNRIGQIPTATIPNGPTGDTASSKATGGNLTHTLARHARISTGMTGMRITNMLIGGGGRGRGSGDHQNGRALDVQGPRLGEYVNRVRGAGGFAEIHGSGAGRHAHAVMGDTASPHSGSGIGGGVNVTVPLQVVGQVNADEISGLQEAITSVVIPAVNRWQQQRRERGK